MTKEDVQVLEDKINKAYKFYNHIDKINNFLSEIPPSEKIARCTIVIATNANLEHIVSLPSHIGSINLDGFINVISNNLKEIKDKLQKEVDKI